MNLKRAIKSLSQEDLLLYSLLAIVNTTTLMFLTIYFIWVPFWPARIVHILYLSFNLSLIYYTRKKKYLFVKVSILVSNLIQLSLATFLWFPLSTNYYLFYFLLPMGSFAIFNMMDNKEKIMAFSICFLSLSLFFTNHYLGVNYYIFQLSPIATSIISFLTITSTMIILIIYFYLHAYFLAQKKLELEYLANTDSLTNIFNRRNFYSLGELEFDLALKYKHTFSLLLIDIDHFKNINDSYGHDAGDEVLKQFAQLIKDNVRQQDIFARHGGEEFTLLLRNTDAEKARRIADKIRTNVEQMDVITDFGTLKITISIGLVEFSNHYPKFDSLILLADKALYEAKDKGRNRVVYMPPQIDNITDKIF